MCKRPPRMCVVLCLLFLLQSHYIYLCICVLARQAGSRRQGRGVAAAPVEVATQQSPRLTLNIFCLISMLVTHILTVRYPLPASLFLPLFFLIYFRIYLYIFACLVTFYLPLSHTLCPSNLRHFVNSVLDSLYLSLSLWYALLGRLNDGREGGGEPLEHFLSSNFPGKAIITRLSYTLPAHATCHMASHRIASHSKC